MTYIPPAEVYRKVLEREQECLWSDLNIDLRQAANGYWSIAAESRVQRIINIARVIGFTDWGNVQIPLLSSGIYAEVLLKLEVEAPEMDLSPYQERTVYPPVWTLTKLRIFAMEVD